jgi:hypothetical protein
MLVCLILSFFIYVYICHCLRDAPMLCLQLGMCTCAMLGMRTRAMPTSLLLKEGINRRVMPMRSNAGG